MITETNGDVTWRVRLWDLYSTAGRKEIMELTVRMEGNLDNSTRLQPRLYQELGIFGS